MKKNDNINSYDEYVEKLLLDAIQPTQSVVADGSPLSSVERPILGQVVNPNCQVDIVRKYYRSEYIDQSYNNITLQYLNLSYKDYCNKVASGFGPY